LWFIEAIRAFLHYSGDEAFVRHRLYPKLKDIIDWHVRGTRYGIHVDSDGLLACGEPGVQLTWMDAKVGEYVVTPRTGKPVEIQALWYNALRIMADFAQQFDDHSSETLFSGLADEAKDAFNARFWNPTAGCLYDVVENGHCDGSIRPNQVFAVSLTHTMLSAEKAGAVVQSVQNELLTPMGLRTLSRHDPRYRAHYEGGVVERDTAYHLGTVWPWMMGPFITAYLKVNRRSEPARQQAESWLAGFGEHLATTGLGQICEIADAEYPHTPRGCIAQAWSVAEILRAAVEDVFAGQALPVKATKRTPSRAGQTASLAKAARSAGRLSTTL
jgi:glycogen debranching enzyme